MVPMELTDEQFYEKVWNLRFNYEQLTWQEIAEQLDYPYSGNTLQKTFSRVAKKLKRPYRRKKASEREEIIPKDEMDAIMEIRKIKYGKLEPTLYVSPLSTQEWHDEFIYYDYGIDDPDEIRKIRLKWRTPYLARLTEILWDDEVVEYLILLPRGYGKTERVIAIFVRWILEVRKPLYIITPSSSHSKMIMGRIINHIKSPRIRRVYGDILSKVSYDKEMMTVEYHSAIPYTYFDHPVAIVTWFGAKEGVHPAWMHFEDVWQKVFKNIESNQDIKFRFSKTFEKMRTRRGGVKTKMTFTGTRSDLKDPYNYLIEEYNIPLLHVRAINEDDSITYCPNYTEEDLREARERDPRAFETTMNNNPVPPEGNYFNINELDVIDELPEDLMDKSDLILGVCDPAFGMTDEHDNTAIHIIALYRGDIIIFDGFSGKMKMEEIAFYIYDANHVYDVMNFFVEKAFLNGLKLHNHLKGISNVIPYLQTNPSAKIVRISAMKIFFRMKKIKIYRKAPQYNDFLMEYLQYDEEDSTEGKKDDNLDALAIIVRKFASYLTRGMRAPIRTMVFN